jgi:apolipoprotein N-acyltransferase
MPLKLALAALTAILLMLAFPPANLAMAAAVGVAPLLYAVAGESLARRLLLGWAAGIAYWAGSCYWIQYVLAMHGGMAAWASWLGFVAFFLYKGLHLAAFSALAGFLILRPFALLTLPALWVAVEWTHTRLGFAWLDLGNAGAAMSVPLRLAPITGVYGISFVFAMTGTALALAALRQPRRELAPVLALPLLYLLPPVPEAARGDRPAVLVQPNISESAEWTLPWTEEMHRRLEGLSVKAALESPGAAPGLLVWPEAPAPMYYDSNPEFRERVNEVARLTRSYLLLNVVPRTPSGAPLNSALLVSPDGRPLGRYDKMNLVPFGEYVPAPFRALVDKVSTEVGDFAPGRSQVLLPAGAHRIGAFICYESVFPDFVRRFAAEGADLLVNISNDGWYGHTAARDQHLLIVRMRAAENRRWVLRATNDGITSTVDPGGRVYRNLPSFEAAAARTAFSYVQSTTFYSRHGDWFVLVCAVCAAAGLAARFLTA